MRLHNFISQLLQYLKEDCSPALPSNFLPLCLERCCTRISIRGVGCFVVFWFVLIFAHLHPSKKIEMNRRIHVLSEHLEYLQFWHQSHISENRCIPAWSPFARFAASQCLCWAHCSVKAGTSHYRCSTGSTPSLYLWASTPRCSWIPLLILLKCLDFSPLK